MSAPADITLNVNGLCYVDLDPSNTGTAGTTYGDNCDLADTGLDYADSGGRQREHRLLQHHPDVDGHGHGQLRQRQLRFRMTSASTSRT